jgi:hypothetical protein
MIMRLVAVMLGLAIALAGASAASSATRPGSSIDLNGIAVEPASRSAGEVVAAATGMVPKHHPHYHHYKHKYGTPKSRHTR